MMSKLIRLRQGLAVIIPEELCNKLGLEQGQEVSVKESKFGLFMNPSKASVKPETREFSKEEVDVIDKLLSLKFADRTLDNVNGILNQNEKKILSKLIEEKSVNLFKSQKYKEGVYNVRDKTYDIIKKAKLVIGGRQESEKPVEKKEVKAERGKPEASEEFEIDPLKRLEKQGYVVIDNEIEARRLSEDIATKGKKKDITGIRGFDKKYYVLKSSFFIKNQAKIKGALKEGKKSLDQISAETGIDKQACVGILAVLNEAGEVIEKRRGLFVLSD